MRRVIITAAVMAGLVLAGVGCDKEIHEVRGAGNEPMVASAQ